MEWYTDSRLQFNAINRNEYVETVVAKVKSMFAFRMGGPRPLNNYWKNQQGTRPSVIQGTGTPMTDT